MRSLCKEAEDEFGYFRISFHDVPYVVHHYFVPWYGPNTIFHVFFVMAFSGDKERPHVEVCWDFTKACESVKVKVPISGQSSMKPADFNCTIYLYIINAYSIKFNGKLYL